MKANTPWRRVSKRERCPICERSDWCLIVGPEGSPEAAICTRTESAKRIGESGWLHRLRSDDWQRPAVRTIRIPAARPAVHPFALPCLAAECEAKAFIARVDEFAESLGVRLSSLTRLQVGWSDAHNAWTFPMKDAQGDVLGIRLRLPSGRKLAVRGGHEGLFIPLQLPDVIDRLLICEGPTDCAALLDLGLAAIGRPSCTGGIKLIVDLVRGWNVADVVIVADSDEPGQRGASNLATVLAVYCRAVRIITPPADVKDAREWKRRGATRADVLAVIDAAPVKRLGVRVGKAVRHG